ncbi:MAG: autotransporter-associated beta strand repeat-containing protein [Phycisphaeraceae bacterium]
MKMEARHMNYGLIIATAAALGIGGAAAQAANITWLGGDAGDETNFNNAANWVGGNLPAFYDENTAASGDIAVFDGNQVGLDNKTPTMTAAFGDGVNNSTTWGLRGVRFVDSGWTLDTGAFTLYVSRQGTDDLRSEATSGTNTVNGAVRFGARDTNDFSDVYVAAGGTLRLNANVGIAIDGGGNFSGRIDARGGGTLELNTTGAFGSSGLAVFEGTTVRFFAETAGGVTGIGTGGLNTDNTRTLTISNGTVDVNGARSSLAIATLVLSADGVLTNGNLVTTETITTKAASSQNLAGLITGNLNMSYGANASAATTVSNNNTYTGTTTVASSSGGGATNTVVVTLNALANTNSPLGNGSSAIILGNSGNSTTHAALLTNGAIEIGRDITLGAATNAAGLKTIGATAIQVGNSTFSGTITVGNASQAHLTVTAPTGVMVSITGNIMEHATAGDGNLTKIGDGTVRLTGNNTYAGVTTVSAGTLLVNGTHTGGGGVNVNAGTLGGTGATSGPVSVDSGANVAPGIVAGSLFANGSFDLKSGATLTIELGGTTFTFNGTEEYDRLKVNGVTDLAGDLAVSLIGGHTLSNGNLYGILHAVAGRNNTFGNFNEGDIVLTQGLLNLKITYDGNITDGSVSLTGGNDVVLYAQLIPEPGTLALMGLAGLFLLPRRRGA